MAMRHTDLFLPMDSSRPAVIRPLTLETVLFYPIPTG